VQRSVLVGCRDEAGAIVSPILTLNMDHSQFTQTHHKHGHLALFSFHFAMPCVARWVPWMLQELLRVMLPRPATSDSVITCACARL